MHAQVGNISLGPDRNVVVGERVTLAPAGTLIVQQGCSPTIGCAWSYRWRQTPTAPALGWIPEGHAHCAGVAPNTGGLSVTATIPDVPVGTQLHFSFRASYRNTAGHSVSAIDYITFTVAAHPTLAISVDNAAVAEGGMATFTIAYAGNIARTVDWAVSGEAATEAMETLTVT